MNSKNTCVEMLMKNIYTSVACNRNTEAVDWGSNGLIAFAAQNAVCILNPKFNGDSAKITHTYAKHKKHVNTVQWLRSTTLASETCLISGADDGLVIFWNLTDLDNPQDILLMGHESGVNAVSGVQHESGWLLATAAGDSSIKLWLIQENAGQCFQTILLNTGFCFVLRLSFMPKSSDVLLAFSSDDDSISLWASAPSADSASFEQFQPLHKLTGHEDWVRGLDFVSVGEDLLIASSSQDSFIRLWRIMPRTEEQAHKNNMMDIFKVMEEGSHEIHMEEKMFQLPSNKWFAISLESVLYGHEGWVYGVHWHNSEKQGLRLLSSSIDKTLIIWEATEDGIWMENLRVGEVGGNSLGFFGGKISSDGCSFMGHSYQGGFHIWSQSAEDEQVYIPNVIVGGHYGEVRDIAWEPKGEYLMSVSADQTTRIHAPWRRQCESADTTWHELARPQVHGYDMQALAILSRYKYVSGAEEKIMRTFQAPANFIENFRRIAIPNEEDPEGDALLKTLPKGASVPSLGLSNKAVFDTEAPAVETRHVKDEYPEDYFMPVTMHTPPQEETLMQNTLWPEMQKLYGHGYEIFALAASSDGKVLASACRATTAEHAQIILWNTTTWKQIQKLASHQLTITQLRFSPNCRYLLSVSRDRRWSLFEGQDHETNPTFKLTASTNKSNGIHTRIIWTCDWSHDSKVFATASRDGKVIVWKQSNVVPAESCSLNGWEAWAVLELKTESVTALAFATQQLDIEAYLVALGLESGIIKIYKFHGEWHSLMSLNNDQAHQLTVKRLQFRPICCVQPNQFQLASCGEDHFLKIYEFNM